MECTECNHPDTSVMDSRKSTMYGGSIRRRRKCDSCGIRFTTYELLDTNVNAMTNRPNVLEAIQILEETTAKLKKLPTQREEETTAKLKKLPIQREEDS